MAPRGKTLRRVRNVNVRHPPLQRHTPGANSAVVSRAQKCFILTCPKTATGYFSNRPNRSVCGNWNGGGGRRAMEQVHGFWKWGRANARANKRSGGLGDIQLPRCIFLHSLTSGVYTTKPCEAVDAPPSTSGCGIALPEVNDAIRSLCTTISDKIQAQALRMQLVCRSMQTQVTYLTHNPPPSF